jgi:hypothetical protein
MEGSGVGHLKLVQAREKPSEVEIGATFLELVIDDTLHQVRYNVMLAGTKRDLHINKVRRRKLRENKEGFTSG